MILGFICGGKGFVSGGQDQYILGIISPNLPGKETCVKKAGLGGGMESIIPRPIKLIF
jgi:hypothetical protein